MKKFFKNKLLRYTNLVLAEPAFIIKTSYYITLSQQFFLFLYEKSYYNFFHTYFFKLLLFFNIKNAFFFTYFFLNFTRLQIFFSFVLCTFKLFKAFSSGFLLRVFSVLEKKNRRVVKKYTPLLIFLKIFFFKVLRYGSEIWFCGFKKKYIPVIYDIIGWVLKQKILWIFKKSFGCYQFRRVKAIKKRIRRVINKK